MNNIPILGHHSPRPISLFTTIIKLASTAHRNKAMVMVNRITTPVVCSVSFRVGQTTRFASATESLAKAKKRLPRPPAPPPPRTQQQPSQTRSQLQYCRTVVQVIEACDARHNQQKGHQQLNFVCHARLFQSTFTYF